MPSRISPCLWFDGQAEEAAELYTSLFPDSRIVHVGRFGEAGPGPAGEVMVVVFELEGQQIVALNGGPMFTFSEAISLQIACSSQEEVDHYWDGLLAGGGEEGPCGWLKDRFGLSWQVTPTRLTELIADPDPEVSERVTRAMMGMKRIDIAACEEAAAGAPA